MDIAISALLIVTALTTVGYWIDFYARGSVHVIKEEWYFRFERSFTLADLWMAACAMTASVCILTGNSHGTVFALLAAGSLIFLGLMDLTFNIQNRLWHLLATSNQMRFELLIILWTIGLGMGLIVYSWPRLADV